MLQRFLAIASNTFVETIRQPIYGVVLLVTACLLALNVSLAAFTLDDDDKLLLDLGLSTLLLGGLFLSSFSAAGILSREIENKTVLTVISKPVSRPLFVLGKFFGLLGALLIAFYLCALVFMLTVRHGVLANSADPWDAPVLVLGFGSVFLSILLAGLGNYFYDRDFPTTVISLMAIFLTLTMLVITKVDEHWELIPFASNFIAGQVLLATYLVSLIVIIMAAVALAASTRFGQLMTLVICTCVLGMGIVADSTFGQFEGESIMAAFAYRVVPNIGLFWVIDGLHAGTEKTAVTFEYVGYATVYTLLFTTGIVGISIAAFQKREVG